ncbi:MAG: hypothetical protein BGO81_17420 [Devosia sp. 66-22]|nr:MAG: hypothetical protein BGO81_17420 [Devosia sp. 66-22]
MEPLKQARKFDLALETGLLEHRAQLSPHRSDTDTGGGRILFDRASLAYRARNLCLGGRQIK